jgi:predicted small secreted protein
MKRSTALVLMSVLAVLLLAGCQTIKETRDIKPVTPSST